MTLELERTLARSVADLSHNNKESKVSDLPQDGSAVGRRAHGVGGHGGVAETRPAVRGQPVHKALQQVEGEQRVKDV